MWNVVDVERESGSGTRIGAGKRVWKEQAELGREDEQEGMGSDEEVKSELGG